MLAMRRPLSAKGGEVPWLLGTLALLSGVVFVLQGCKGTTDAVPSKNPPDNAAVSARTSCVRDRTEAGCPPELLAKVMALVPGRDLNVYDRRFTWLSRPLIRFETDYGDHIMFVRRDGAYVRVNSKDSLQALNAIFQEYKFARSEFEDLAAVDSFLYALVDLYGDFPYFFVGSSLFVKWTERTQAVYGGTADWVRGTEKDVAVFLDLCRDPVFVFRDNTWTTGFNVFEGSGSVDRWRVTGQFDPKTERNRFWTIEIANIKPKGTFSPVMSR